MLNADLIIFGEPGGERADAKLVRHRLSMEGRTLEEIEREAIRLCLRRHGGKRAAVIKELHISKTTLLKKIAEWGLEDESPPENCGNGAPEKA